MQNGLENGLAYGLEGTTIFSNRNTAKKKSNTKKIDLKEMSEHDHEANIKPCALKQVFNLIF